MRNGQNNNKRMRNRNNNNNNNNNNNRRGQNPMTRVFESNGPDIKIRGTASHVAEKYVQLARDARSSGDPVAAENYYQHAEHYFRLIATAQEQFRQQNPNYAPPPNPQGQNAPQGAADDNYDDDDDGQPFSVQNEPGFAPQPQVPQQAPQHVPQAQPYLPRDAQPFPPRDQHQPRPQHHQPQHQNQPQRQPYVQPTQPSAAPDVNGLPAFITGGGSQQPQPDVGNGGQPDGPSGQDQGDRQDRFGHRRRRRHRPGGGFQRPDNFGNVAPQGGAPNDGGGDEPPRQPD
ncbi:MAG TPA: DUF4167 domain-containing protein [Pseudolabrys sp.]|nr:DUF4167 domain-containing protein [Pseudolabrys sp.]